MAERAADRQTPVPAPTSSEAERLAAEREARLRAERASALMERLQAIAAELAGAGTRDQIAAALLERGAEALGLRNAALHLRVEGGVELVRAHGYPPDFVERFSRLPFSAGLPVTDAVAKNTALFFASRDDYARAYPGGEQETRPAGAPPVAFVALPLATGVEAVGVLTLAWPEEHEFEPGERRFLLLLAHHAAQALERAALLDRLQADLSARKRLERMQQLVAEAGRVLAGPLQAEEMVQRAVQLVAPEWADYCFVDLLDETGRFYDRVAAASGPAAPLQGESLLRRRFPVDLALPWSLPAVVESRRPRLERGLDAALLAQSAADDQQRQAVLASGVRSAATAPLLARGSTIGALTLAACVRDLDEQDLWLSEELARSLSLAIDSARLFAAERRARVRITRMQEVTAALSRASTPQAVAEVACRIGADAMEARSGALWVREAGGPLQLAGSWGVPADYLERFRRIAPGDRQMPAARVAETGQPLWVEDEEDYRRAGEAVFEGARAAGRVSAWSAVPLHLRGQVAGVLSFSHAAPHRYDEDERAFCAALAQHCAQALDRAQLLAAERASNERLRLLSAVSESLASSLDLDVALADLAQRLVPAFADWCLVDLLEGRTLRRVATVHLDAQRARQAHEYARQHPSRLGDDGGLARVIESGETTFVERLSPELVDRHARDDAHRAQMSKVVSVISVPLAAEGGTGVITFCTAESGRVYGAADVELAREIARRANAAVTNAAAFAREQRSRERIAALQQLTSRLTRASTAHEVAGVLINAGAELGAEVCAVYSAGERLRLLAHRGLDEGALKDLRELGIDEERPVSAAARLRQPIFIESPEQHAALFPGHAERAAPTLGAIESLACVPMRAGDRVLGVLVYVFRGLHPFDAEERAFLSALADNCGQSLDRARLLDATRAEASRAERASRVKDEFLAILGHELRNPLAPIFTALELMKLRAQPGADVERKVIERQARHLARLVDDLLDVSRITAGRVQLERAPLELAEVVARGIELARPLIEENRHSLTTSIDRGLRVSGDLTRLSQVMSNLLNNAAKYTRPGGRIRVEAVREGGEAVLRVRDSGVGIAPGLLSRIFEPFAQGEQSLDRARGGLGLGLAIVKSLVQLHGGTVAADSEGEGRGAELVVRLPALSPDVAPQPTPVAVARLEPRERRGRVLVVDDNRDAAEMVAEALSLSGFATCVAFDGPSALAAAPSFAPDVALLDLGLPVMDGFALARRLRELEGLSGLRLVAVTGYGQPSDRDRSRQAGFDEHLVKPVELDQMEGVVARLIGDEP